VFLEGLRPFLLRNPKAFLKTGKNTAQFLMSWGFGDAKWARENVRNAILYQGIKNVLALPNLDRLIWVSTDVATECGCAADRKQTTATYSLRLPLRWLSLPFGHAHCQCHPLTRVIYNTLIIGHKSDKCNLSSLKQLANRASITPIFHSTKKK